MRSPWCQTEETPFVTKVVQGIKQDGFCIVEGIIPQGEIEEIRARVVAAQRAHDEKAAAELAKTRARGHRIGARGVAVLKQVLNATQCIAPYLADERILGTAETFFGPFVRISCTDCVINYPGNEGGYWHADWPYNATNSSHIPAPYPDALLHLSTIWMLTDFTVSNGGTFLVPRSHRIPNNPAAGGMEDVDCDAQQPGETQATGKAGSVLLYDSRLWHAVAPNKSDQPRVALVIRYAPWWLNLTPSIRGTPDHARMVIETGGKNYDAVPLGKHVFGLLPENVKPLYQHCVEE